MEGLKRETYSPELLKAIKDSINDARDSVKKMAQLFADNIRSLRVEESEIVFTNLTQNISYLQCFMEFMYQLKEGMNYFDGFGMPTDPLLSGDSGLNLFKEMNSTFEARDWILLSDLIEYELSPLLIKEDEWLETLAAKLTEHEA